MEAVKIVSGIAMPLGHDDVDTDRMIPIRFLRKPLSDGYGNFLFRDDRFDAQGNPKGDFIFNDSRYQGANILIGGRNFGCGSAREGAVYAVRDYGFHAVIATSFSDIFRINCYNNGVLPVVLPEETVQRLCNQLLERPGAVICVDLETQKVSGPDGASYEFAIDGAIRERLLAGLDDVGITLQLQDRVAAFEREYLGRMPWIGRVPAQP